MQQQRKNYKFVDKQQVFNYLDDLRDSGVTNMFGASSYIVEKFKDDLIKEVLESERGISRRQCERRVDRMARDLLVQWMDSKDGVN